MVNTQDLADLLDKAKLLENASPGLLEFIKNISPVPAPRGTASNFDNPVNRAATLTIVSSIALAISVLFFLNRVYVKAGMKRKFTWDDATLLLAMLGSIAHYIASILQTKHGLGVHMWNIRVSTAIKDDFMISTYLVQVLSPLTFFFLKPTFFILYLELFASELSLRVCSWIGLVFTSAAYTAFTIATFVYSTPPKGVPWYQQSAAHGLKEIMPITIVTSSVGLLIDMFILLIPIIGVWGLTMSRKRKIGVMLIFFSGAMACICAAFSIYFRIRLHQTKDATWTGIDVNICTICEISIGIVCACIPSVAYVARQSNSLYRKLFTRIKSTISTSKASQSSSSASHPTAALEAKVDVLKSTDRKYARYFSLGDLESTMTTVVAKGADDTNATNVSMVSGIRPFVPNSHLHHGE